MPDSFKFQKDFLAGARRRELEMLSIPCDTSREILYVSTKSIVFVPGIRRCNVLPRRIIEINNFSALRIADEDFPTGVEVVFRSWTPRLRVNSDRSYSGEQGNAQLFPQFHRLLLSGLWRGREG